MQFRVYSWQNKKVVQISARNSLTRKNQIGQSGRGEYAGYHRTFKRRGSRLDYHERFGGTLEFDRRQRSLRSRQSERCDGCDRLILICNS